VAVLIVLAALYFWDVNYNHGALSDGVIRMGWQDILRDGQLESGFRRARRKDAFVKNNRVEPSTPRTNLEPPAQRTITEPSRLPPIGLPKSERDETRERVSNFKAYQERVARERERFAASLLKRMLDPIPPPPADRSS
jgi:hypothetical protein